MFQHCSFVDDLLFVPFAREQLEVHDSLRVEKKSAASHTRSSLLLPPPPPHLLRPSACIPPVTGLTDTRHQQVLSGPGGSGSPLAWRFCCVCIFSDLVLHSWRFSVCPISIESSSGFASYPNSSSCSPSVGHLFSFFDFFFLSESFLILPKREFLQRQKTNYFFLT